MGQPTPFGYKMAWLAVRADEAEDVIERLGIEEAKTVTWQEGVDSLYASTSMTEHPVFVTPALDGWVLVASPGYFDEASDADPERLSSFVTDAAHRLGTEVHFFATHRVVEGHAWASAGPDGLQRAYFYLGEVDEVLVDEGARTPFEESLDCLEAGGPDVADESTVMSVAEAWSVDPTKLDTRFPDAGDGMLGTMRVAAGEVPEDAQPGASQPRDPGRPWWRFW